MIGSFAEGARDNIAAADLQTSSSHCSSPNMANVIPCVTAGGEAQEDGQSDSPNSFGDQALIETGQKEKHISAR
jgi:hypothetical protein